jgi:hypothetical protein
MTSRRRFLQSVPASLVGASAGGAALAASAETPGAATPGAPPVFGGAPPSGPPVTADTFAQAEKLLQVSLTPAQREQAVGSWATTMAPLASRRIGPHALALPDALPPATTWHPLSIGPQPAAVRERFRPLAVPARPLPASDADIAYAPVTQLAQ